MFYSFFVEMGFFYISRDFRENKEQKRAGECFIFILAGKYNI